MATHRKTTSSRDLIIAHWNANGIINKKTEVMDFISKHKIDILLLNETRLQGKHKCKFPGYNSFRKERPGNTPAGGVAIICRNNIECTEIEFNTNSCEAHGIRLTDNLTIITLYISPKNKISTKDLHMLTRASNKVLIAGDLNAKHQVWNCHNTNRNGRLIKNFARNKQCAIKAPENHTLFPYNNSRPSTVDLAIIKNLRNFESIETLNELDSDHHPILITLRQEKVATTRNSFLNYKKADWNQFTNYITEHLTIEMKLKDPESIDRAVNTLTQIINDATITAIPRTNQKLEAIELPLSIRQEIANRNKIRKLYQNTNKKSYKTLYNYYSKIVSKMINKHFNSQWENKVNSLTTKDNSIWKMTKALSKDKNDAIPSLHSERGLVFSNKEKANALATNFEKVHYLTENMSDYITERTVNKTYRYIKNKKINQETINLTSPKEIARAIKQTRPRKAPGVDGIQNILLKNIPKKALVQLTYIFNACFKLSHFPKQWKQATVLAFKKPGKDKLFPQNYRPISLLNTQSKVFEKIILNRLKKFESEQKQLLQEQFGFREHHSTIHQLARLTNHISTQYNQNKSTTMVLLDIEKAFDTV